MAFHLALAVLFGTNELKFVHLLTLFGTDELKFVQLLTVVVHLSSKWTLAARRFPILQREPRWLRCRERRGGSDRPHGSATRGAGVAWRGMQPSARAQRLGRWEGIRGPPGDSGMFVFKQRTDRGVRAGPGSVPFHEGLTRAGRLLGRVRASGQPGERASEPPLPPSCPRAAAATTTPSIPSPPLAPPPITIPFSSTNKTAWRPSPSRTSATRPSTSYIRLSHFVVT